MALGQLGFALLVTTVLCTSTAFILLIQASQGESRLFAYSYLSLLLCTTIVKACMAGCFVASHKRKTARLPIATEDNVDNLEMQRLGPAEDSDGTVAMRIPSISRRSMMFSFASAILYAINDIFVFVVMQHFDGSSYAVLVTGKIAVVALLSRVVLRRKLTSVQYTSCILLTAGIVTFQYQFCGDGSENAPLSSYLVVLVAEVVGGVAGIFNEYIMKQQEQASLPVHYQNLMLYISGILVYSVCMMVAEWGKDPFRGFSTIIVFIIPINAVRGVAISQIYKQATNMTKIFIVIPGIILTWVFSAIYLEFEFTVQAIVAIIIIFCALYLYMSQDSEQLPLDPVSVQGGLPPERIGAVESEEIFSVGLSDRESFDEGSQSQ